jgi:hypothetical protein
MPRTWNDYDYFRITTTTGLKYIDKLTYRDVAHSLANQNRFSGHLDRQVSIGMHSLHCLSLAAENGFSKRMQKAALWHDGPESYYSDIPTYVKAHFGEATKSYIDTLDEDFFRKFRYPTLNLNERAILKEIDRTALTLEAMYGLDNFDLRDWPIPTLYHWTHLINEWARLPIQIEDELIHQFRRYQNV